MKTTQYFRYTRQQPDRATIKNENIYLDLDSEGRVVSMTIEHAGQSADMKEFLYQRIPADMSPS